MQCGNITLYPHKQLKEVNAVDIEEVELLISSGRARGFAYQEPNRCEIFPITYFTLLVLDYCPDC